MHSKLCRKLDLSIEWCNIINDNNSHIVTMHIRNNMYLHRDKERTWLLKTS